MATEATLNDSPLNMAASSSTTSSPPSSSASPKSSAQIEQYLAKATSVFKSTRTHPRRQARIGLLSAIALGSVLNFLTLPFALTEHYENAPIVVTVWVGIVVCFPFPFSGLFFSFLCTLHII